MKLELCDYLMHKRIHTRAYVAPSGGGGDEDDALMVMVMPFASAAGAIASHHRTSRACTSIRNGEC